METREPLFPVVKEPSKPIVRSIETHDFDLMAQTFVRWNHRFEQLSRGPFRGRLRFADLDGVQLFDAQVNQVIRCRGERAPDSFTFSPVQRSNAGAQWRGRTLKPGMVNVGGPRQETDHRTCRDYRHTALTVRRDLLERATLGLAGVGLDQLLGAKAAQIDPSVADALVSRWRAALLSADPVQEDRTYRDCRGLNTMELVTDLVRVLASGHVADPVRMTPAQRTQIVWQAEDFARNHPPERVTILALCHLTGVSERSLHYAFLDVTGLSPKAYMKSIRLNEARREILICGRDRGQISSIARKYGFHRPGNFAADYHRQFGDLPSGVRNRPQIPNRSPG